MSSNPSSATAYDASNPAPTPNQASPTTASTQVKSPPLDPSAPGDWVVDNHRNNIVTALHSVKSGERSFRVHFAEMQRMHMRKVQVKLIKHGVEMRATNKESPGWEEDLKEYSKHLHTFAHQSQLAIRLGHVPRYTDRYQSMR